MTMKKDYLEHIFDKVDPNIHLDQEQKKVITTPGDLFVIAGAGSGKTTTMVAKVKYLIEIEKVKPNEILLISYTNKATEELKERIQKQFSLPISILTFHKLGMKLLKGKKYQIQSDPKPIIQNYCNQLKTNKKYSYLFYTRKYRIKKDQSKLILLCETFIKNYKMKGRPNISKMKLSKFWKSFFENLISYYDNCLTLKNEIDFEDMILKSIECISKKQVSLNYRYIIVDEYQDISRDRFLLLQELKKHFHCHLIVVGDDWQSIFGFSGSEISLFIKFETFFPQAKQLKIKNTYRNSQELIDIAGTFVMKNPSQIKKQLFSSKHLKNPMILVPYQNDLAKQLQKILEHISTFREHSTIFLLGRYHQDFNIQQFPFLNQKNSKIMYSKCPNLYIEFLTVHSSKGLGADEVILLNGNRGIYGFPTNKKIDKLLKTVESIDKSYPYAEERRLFYVALTRTKNHVFIMYSKKNPSPFIQEIKKMNITAK